MPRKPRIQRLSEASTLVTAYEQAGMADDYRARFARDMIVRLTRERGLSKKQKDWLDSLIEEGVPAPKGDQELIQRIKAAIALPGMEHCATPLGDFLSREVKGYDLSPKQRVFLDKMLEEADHVRKHGPWMPSEKQEKQIRLCISLAKGRTGMYWGSHPGEGRALASVTDYVDGNKSTVDKWSVERIIKSFGAKLRELDNPYAEPGSMIWARKRGTYDPTTYTHHWVISPALIAGSPEINERGDIVYPVLVDGEMTFLGQSNLRKRKPKDK